MLCGFLERYNVDGPPRVFNTHHLELPLYVHFILGYSSLCSMKCYTVLFSPKSTNKLILPDSCGQDYDLRSRLKLSLAIWSSEPSGKSWLFNHITIKQTPLGFDKAHSGLSSPLFPLSFYLPPPYVPNSRAAILQHDSLAFQPRLMI